MTFKRKKDPKTVVAATKYDLSEYLSKEKDLFSAILKCMIEEDVDLSIKRQYKWKETDYKPSKTYNEKILVSLVVTKRFFYFWEWKHLSYGELLCIRWLAKDLWELKDYYKRYPNMKEVPELYDQSFEVFHRAPWITTEQIAEKIMKDLNKSSLHKYIKPIKESQYCSCISVFLNNLINYNKGNLIDTIMRALINFFKWFRVWEFLLELYDWDSETHSKYETSFEKVLNSPTMKRKLGKTWDRFYEKFSKKIEEKILSVIKNKR